MELGEIIKDLGMEHLRETTARGIIVHIEKWRKGKQSTAKRRWIFELLQNALDTAKDRDTHDVQVVVETDEKRVIFRHNAGFFTPKEINMLIRSGSSKPYSKDSHLTGRFGSGFLVTHILARQVRVLGVLKREKEYFQFDVLLNRQSDDPALLAKRTDESYSQLSKITKIVRPPEFMTEYIYEVSDELGKDAIKVAIRELKKSIPFLFSFNNISEIRVNGTSFTKTKVNEPNYEKVTVGGQYVYLRGDDSLRIGILLNESKIADLTGYPNIFISLPLTATSDYMKIPFIINSPSIIPTDDRDSLLDEDINNKLIESAFSLFLELCKDLSEENDLKDYFQLINFSLIKQEEASQKPIFRLINNQIREILSRLTTEVPLVETSEGKMTIQDTSFPILRIWKDRKEIMSKKHYKKFYLILSQVKNNLPKERIVEEWSQAIIAIEKLLPNNYLYTLNNLIEWLKEFITEGSNNYKPRDEFENHFGITNAKTFLLELFDLVDDLYQGNQIDSPEFIDYLLLAQDDTIDAHVWGDENSILHREEGLTQEFKDIITKVGYDIRQYLIDQEFLGYKVIQDLVRETLNPEKSITTVINNHMIKDEKIEEWDETIEGWVELFHWCILNYGLRENFPIITKNNLRVKLDDMERGCIFPPFEVIGLNSKYEKLFRQRRIMNGNYFKSEKEKRSVEKFGELKVIISSLPSLKSETTLVHSKLRSILLDPEDIELPKHNIVTTHDLCGISYIPFWDEVKQKGSENKKHARLFIEFLLEIVMETDEPSFHECRVKCSCSTKSHSIIPLEWLARLKTEKWVPTDITTEGKETTVLMTASYENIRRLFPENGLDELIKSHTSRVGVLFPHFGFDALNLKIKLYSLNAGVSENDTRDRIAKIVDIDAELFAEIVDFIEDTNDVEGLRQAMSKLQEKKEKNLLKEINKQIGENLEYVIREIISKYGFKVTPIYIGGDMEIWPDSEEGWDSGRYEIESLILEIKFTSGTRVHLTKTQSESSRNKRGQFFVLVVENAQDLRQQLYELEDDKIEEQLIEIIIENSHIIGALHEKLGSLPNLEEVEPDIHGYWLKKKLWSKAENLDKWIQHHFR